MMGREIRQHLERMIAAAMAGARWLVLPIALLLFLQWPLRDLLRAWSREANDTAQWIFALYVAAAVTQATRHGLHLAIAGMAQRYSPGMRDAIGRIGVAVCLLPWAGLVLVVGFPAVWQSVRQLEAFSDTANPGYFLIRLSAWLLAALMLTQGVLDLTRARGR